MISMLHFHLFASARAITNPSLHSHKDLNPPSPACVHIIRYPSSFPALRGLTRGQAAIPVLIIGFGKNGDCIPRRGNYAAFEEAVSGGMGPVTTVVMEQASSRRMVGC